jgi:hypothetical protein
MAKTINYDVVSEIAGHQSNKGVEVVTAAEDIFGKVKNKGMQCAVKGEFKEFDSVEELTGILTEAGDAEYSIRVFDVNIGG